MAASTSNNGQPEIPPDNPVEIPPEPIQPDIPPGGPIEEPGGGREELAVFGSEGFQADRALERDRRERRPAHVLTDEDDVSVLFSFTRSYFHVVVDRPHDLITFLRSILPHKRIAELYISMGFTKHGKTEIYRELLDHLMVCHEDRFDISPGKPGMVMIVFNMPNDDLVFKLIRDRFDTPKKTTRREVMEKYDLVFRHDRAGRLVDAQAFEYLKFDGGCFSDRLLKELKQRAAKSVWIKEDNIIVNHAYVERRVTPLDIFLKEADAGAKVKDVCRRHGISDATYYTWRKKFCGMGRSQLAELKALEKENQRLKKIVADLELDKLILKESLDFLKPKA